MSSFWPKGLDISDIELPMAILERAKSDWDASSSGVVTLVLQKAQTESGNDMIIVHAKHAPSRRTAELFAVVHRPNTPYPVTIQPKSNDLPVFLKKSYYKSGALTDTMRGLGGGKVENDWVADTPSEFRAKLEQAFNLGTVRSEVSNLVSVRVI